MRESKRQEFRVLLSHPILKEANGRNSQSSVFNAFGSLVQSSQQTAQFT
jgi:hypothetical protein